MNNKQLFKAFSFYECVRNLIIRLFAIIIGIYAFAHFEENPVVISIVMFISLLVILYMGSPEIIVYPDRIVKRNDSFISLIRPAPCYLLSEIEEASFDFTPGKPPTIPETGLIILLASIIPKRSPGSNRRTTPVLLKMKDGSTIWLVSELEDDLKYQLTIEINNAKKAAYKMGFAKAGE